HDPLRRGTLNRPVEIGHEEGNCSSDAGQVVIVQDDDAASPYQQAEIIQIDKDSVESVIAIDKGEVELAFCTEEAWQDEVGWLRVVLDQGYHPRPAQHL